jgi:hypothetical protein
VATTTKNKKAKSVAKHNHQVPLDAVTQSNAFGWSSISPHDELIKQDE